MDLKTKDDTASISTAPVSNENTAAPNVHRRALNSTNSDVGSLSAKNMIFRADKIDLKNLDVQLEKHLSRVWSRDNLRERERETELLSQREVWEIDLLKLDMKNVIGHGTYGTVYKGVYDGRNVAVKVLDWGEDGMSTASEIAKHRSSFRQEVAVWHKLPHPNITKFIGAFNGHIESER